ncbi:hypothetical protein DMB90_00830 [Raoultella planticola]|uniref:Uncharacterized protein n=1 Tax=Raoultella planticola TaxID=575 RepID=A0A5P6A8Z2_RAOPL|nr:hypothetical protein DMB90_00830 [Raoultella planticola]
MLPGGALARAYGTNAERQAGHASRHPAKYRCRICSPGKAFTPPHGNNARSGSLTYQLFEQCKGLFHSLLADHKSTQLACCPAALLARAYGTNAKRQAG